MKPFHRLAALSIATLASSLTPAVIAEVKVACNSTMKYVVNRTVDGGGGLAWIQPGYAEPGWLAGTYGVGHDAGGMIATDVGTNVFSVYTRATFNITSQELPAVTNLVLGVDFDDGVIVWLNGVEVLRVNMPGGDPAWNSLAATSHESSNGATCSSQVNANISACIPALVSGQNVLAIGVWNQLPSSTDLALVPKLETNVASPPGAGTTMLSRAPYLQLGTPTSMVVRWRTSTVIGGILRVRDTSGQTVFEEESCPSTEHEFLVSSLQPATKYFYDVLAVKVPGPPQSLAGNDANHFFVTSPPSGTPKFTRIWVLGDSGVPGTAATVRTEYLQYLGSRTTDLWLMLGDNAYEEGTDTQYTDAVFNVFKDVLRNSVLWPTPGNHEYHNNLTSSVEEQGPYFHTFTLPTQGEAGGVMSDTEAYYSFDHGNIHFLSIDSHHYLGNEAIRQDMLDWIEDDLAAVGPGIDWRIAYFHHPPYTDGTHNSDLQTDSNDNQATLYGPTFDVDGGDPGVGRLWLVRKYLLPRLEAGGVDLVLTGHSHVYERSSLLHDLHGDLVNYFGLRAHFNPVLHAVERDGTVPRNGHPCDFPELPEGSLFAPDGPFSKSPGVPADAAVYAVVGNSSKNKGNDNITHPVMVPLQVDMTGAPVRGIGTLHGSLVLEVNGKRLDGIYLDSNGAIRDIFTIRKTAAALPDCNQNGIYDSCDIAFNPSLDANSNGVLDSCDIAPSNLVAQVGCPEVAALTWTINGSGVDGFRIQRGQGGNFSTIATVGPGVTSYFDSYLLTHCATYDYRVQGFDGPLNSEFSNVATVTLLPMSPSGLTAATVSSSQIDLSWSLACEDQDGLSVERRAAGSPDFIQIAAVPTGTTTFSDSGIAPCTQFDYRVRAWYSTGGVCFSGFTNEASATTLSGTGFQEFNFALPATSSARDIASGDVDLDGDQDLVLASANANFIAVGKNQGPGSFAWTLFSNPHGIGTSTERVALADLTGDGRLDIATSHATSGTTLTLLANTGTGSFSTIFYTIQNPFGHYGGMDITAENLDGDGDQDLAIAYGGSYSVRVLLNGGTGGAPGTGAGWVEQSVFLTPHSASAIAAGDFDLDGDVDLAVGTMSGNVMVLQRQGGGYSIAGTFFIGQYVSSIEAANLDGDADLDLVCTATNSSTVNQVVTLQRTAGLSFTQTVYNLGQTNPRTVTAGDFNGDLLVDLAVASQGTSRVTILRNGGGTPLYDPADPSRTFHFVAPAGSRAVAAAHLDTNGKLDLGLGNASSPSDASVWLNVCQ